MFKILDHFCHAITSCALGWRADLLLRYGASPRRTNSDGSLTIGPQVREVARVLAPGAAPDNIRAACAHLIADGYAE